MLRQSVKFGHYSCNSAFMFRSQGSCVQQPQRGFAERAADGHVGISCQEARIKTASYVHEECLMSETSARPVAEVKEFMKGEWKKC